MSEGALGSLRRVGRAVPVTGHEGVVAAGDPLAPPKPARDCRVRSRTCEPRWGATISCAGGLASSSRRGSGVTVTGGEPYRMREARTKEATAMKRLWST